MIRPAVAMHKGRPGDRHRDARHGILIAKTSKPSLLHPDAFRERAGLHIGGERDELRDDVSRRRPRWLALPQHRERLSDASASDLVVTKRVDQIVRALHHHKPDHRSTLPQPSGATVSSILDSEVSIPRGRGPPWTIRSRRRADAARGRTVLARIAVVVDVAPIAWRADAPCERTV